MASQQCNLLLNKHAESGTVVGTWSSKWCMEARPRAGCRRCTAAAGRERALWSRSALTALRWSPQRARWDVHQSAVRQTPTGPCLVRCVVQTEELHCGLSSELCTHIFLARSACPSGSLGLPPENTASLEFWFTIWCICAKQFNYLLFVIIKGTTKQPPYSFK